MLGWEQGQYDRTVTDIFGYHAVQLGLPVIDTLRENRMPFRRLRWTRTAVRTVHAQRPARRASAIVPFRRTALRHTEPDLVTLPHVLEFSEYPHEVLREVARVLMPEGRVVVTCFNPMSLWGPARPEPHRRRALPSDRRAVDRFRAHQDWLKLLGFDIIRGRFGCYCPPYRTERWLQRAAFMEKAGDRWWPIFGAVYMISAIKRVRGVRWSARHGSRPRRPSSRWRHRWPPRPAPTARPWRHASRRRLGGRPDANPYRQSTSPGRAAGTNLNHMEALQEVTIYSDGACKGNPGPGGWGALLVAGTSERNCSAASAAPPTTAWN